MGGRCDVPVKLPLRNCSSANVASSIVTRSSLFVLAEVTVVRACAGGKKNENVIVRGVCKIANFTGGRSVTENYVN
jgi:hypothetical protein